MSIVELAASGWSIDAVPKIVETQSWEPGRRCRCRAAICLPGGRTAAGQDGDEITAIMHALDGGYVPAGPSGSPLRGLINVLPTGPQLLFGRSQGDPLPAGVPDRPGDGRISTAAASR